MRVNSPGPDAGAGPSGAAPGGGAPGCGTRNATVAPSGTADGRAGSWKLCEGDSTRACGTAGDWDGPLSVLNSCVRPPVAGALAEGCGEVGNGSGYAALWGPGAMYAGAADGGVVPTPYPLAATGLTSGSGGNASA